MHVVVVAMARRGAAAKSSGEVPSCIVLFVVEGVISGVDGEYVVRWC